MEFEQKWKTFLEELIDPQFVDVSSLKVQKTLQPDLWDGRTLKPEIVDALYEIAKEFFETLKLDPNIRMLDVTLTGSLATYNWSDYSDADLHILIDFNLLKEREMAEDYFKQKIQNWNRTHKILVKDFEVEIYIQDSNEPHHANGIYSIMQDQWIKEPSRYQEEIDYEMIQKKAAGLMEQIDNIYESYAEKDYKIALQSAEGLMERIKKYRRAGLSTQGINSIENLVFKILRRNDYIKKLISLKILAYDNLMSVNGAY
jgi:NADH dehydrogenase/NADH:ubiquinone oxidoreductase subunit G